MCDIVGNSETHEKSVKTPRVVNYDQKEVWKYMKKRREEQRRSRHVEKEAKVNAKVVKEQKLKELMGRQHAAAAASVAASRRRMAKLQQVCTVSGYISIAIVVSVLSQCCVVISW